jgi:hypothetical protein
MKSKQIKKTVNNLSSKEHELLIQLSLGLASERFNVNERVVTSLMTKLFMIIEKSKAKPIAIINTIKFLQSIVIRELLLAKPIEELRTYIQNYDSKEFPRTQNGNEMSFQEPITKKKSPSSKKNNAGYSTAVTNPSKETK